MDLLDEGDYIQDIAFNYYEEKMAISSTSHKIFIYKKIFSKSTDLISNEKTSEKNDSKETINNLESSCRESDFLKPIALSPILISDEKKKQIDIPKTPLSRSTFNNSIDESKKINQKINNESSINNKKTQDTFTFRKLSNFQIEKKHSPHIKKNIPKFFIENIESYEQNFYEYHWEKIYSWETGGPAFKLQWCHPEYGNILACCGYDKSIYIFKEDKKENKISYNNCAKIQEFSDAVEDISFCPISYGLLLASVTANGFFQIFGPADDSNYSTWESKCHKELISEEGCSCLCFNPSLTDPLTLVIGCRKKHKEILEIKKVKTENNSKSENRLEKRKSENIKGKMGKEILENISKSCNEKDNKDEEKNNNKNFGFNDLIKILYFAGVGNDNKFIFRHGLSINCIHDDDITDIDWANQNGRMYHMICSTSKNGKLVIWEINISEINDSSDEREKCSGNERNRFQRPDITYSKMFEYTHEKPLWRCSFNLSGTLISCIDEDGNTLVFLKTGRANFVKLDMKKI